MKIPVILNSERVILDAKPAESLLEVLRRQGLLSVKEGCTKGKCGSCTVLLDEKPVPSCIIPVGIVRNASIETLEFFLLTKEGEDIAAGFKQAGLNLCGFCNSARIFSTYELLKKVYRLFILSSVLLKREFSRFTQVNFLHLRFLNICRKFVPNTENN